MTHSVYASLVSGAALSANLESGGVMVTGTVDAAASLSLTGRVGQQRAASGAVQAVAALGAAGVRIANVAGACVSAATLRSTLSSPYALSADVQAGAALRATPAVDGQGLLVRDAVHAALSLLHGGCCPSAQVPPCLQEAVIAQVNASLQVIYSSAELLGWFSRQTVTLAFATGEISRPFSRDVQGIHGPVRLEEPRIILRQVTDRAQFERYADLFLGSHFPDGPRAWHLQSMHGSGSDSVDLTLHLAPAPISPVNILVDVILEPPRYDWSDVTSGTALSLPHRYGETLLIPLVRDWATSHELFAEPELLPQIKQQSEMARLVLGLLNPKKTTSPKEAQESR